MKPLFIVIAHYEMCRHSTAPMLAWEYSPSLGYDLTKLMLVTHSKPEPCFMCAIHNKACKVQHQRSWCEDGSGGGVDER